MTEAATPSSNNGKIFIKVSDYIERATRFDGSDVSIAVPEVEADGFVRFKLVQQVNVSATTKETRGRLPSFVDDVSSSQAMQTAMRKRLAETNAQVPAAIERWVGQDDGSYMRMLPTSIVKLPRGAGWEWHCPPCGGVGNVLCTICHGGRIDCYTCYGRRQIRCMTCSGSGGTTCSTCHGSGSVSHYQNNQTVYQTCFSCSGSGRHSCYNCHSSGKVQCTTCYGRGDLQCSTCSGTTRVMCSRCHGMRWLNEFGIFDIEVDLHKTDHKALAIDDAGVQLMEQIDVHQLPEYGNLVHHAHEGGSLSVHSSYTFLIPTLRATLRADDKDFTIHAFGSQAKVFSYENIAGHLLQKDLHSLSMALAPDKTGHVSWQVNVLDKLAEFTRSELNMVLAEELTGTKPSADLHAAVEEKYSGMVSRTYIADASSAFQRAISHIYRAKVAEPTYALVGISLMLGIILTILQLPTAHWISSAALTFIVCGVLWALAETHAQRSIARHFEGNLGKRILELSTQASNIKGWRRWIWPALGVCAFGGAFSVRHFPKVSAWLQDWLIKTF